jgi:general nucleoside transport system permease protein
MKLSRRTLTIGGVWAVLVAAVWIYYAIKGNSAQAVLNSTIPRATPLALGALCGLLGERTGVVNIGIEGQMLFGAFTGFYAATASGSLLVGAVAAIMMSMLVGAFLAQCAVGWRIDQIIAGTVINILAAGLTSFLYAQGKSLPRSLPEWKIPGLWDLPLVGKVLFENTPITFATLIATAVLSALLFNSRWGLRTRAIGEHPSAADTVGVKVYAFRYWNTIIAGGLAGLAGAALSLNTSFERNITNGKGFTALAIMIMGRWKPWLALSAALFFGFLEALTSQLQFEKVIDIAPQFVNMTPYVTTIVVLAVLGGKRVRPPAAAGQPYVKEG